MRPMARFGGLFCAMHNRKSEIDGYGVLTCPKKWLHSVPKPHGAARETEMQYAESYQAITSPDCGLAAIEAICADDERMAELAQKAIPVDLPSCGLLLLGAVKQLHTDLRDNVLRLSGWQVPPHRGQIIFEEVHHSSP